MLRMPPSVGEMGRFTIAALISGVIACAQIGYPGQYPGTYPPGGYPPGTYPGGGTGIPIPGGGRHKKDQDTEALKDDKGKVTEIGQDHFNIETTDHREVTFAVTKDTKFSQHSKAVGLDALGIGQTVDVQSREGDQENFTAVNVLILGKGSATPAASDTPQRSADDNGPPVIHRGGSDTSGATAQPPTAAPAPAKQTAAADAGSDNSNAPSTIVERAPSNTTAEADDGGPPVLHRGKPRADEEQPDTPVPAQSTTAADTTAAAPVETASARIPPSGDDDGSTTLPPNAHSNSASADAFLEQARQTAEQFTEGLPNFTCTEAVTRYFTESTHGTSWQPIDVVTATLVYDQGKESFQNMLVDGKKADPQKTGGAWSYGEFGSVLAGLFDPGLGANFIYRHDDEYNGFMSRMFDIEVEQPRSNWNIHEGGQAFRPAYRGTVWVDKATKRVVRIEMQAVDLPKTFPVDHAEMALDYQYVTLGTHRFLVPTHSEVLMCHRGMPDCSKNVIDFRNYRKYGSETEVTFGQ